MKKYLLLLLFSSILGHTTQAQNYLVGGPNIAVTNDTGSWPFINWGGGYDDINSPSGLWTQYGGCIVKPKDDGSGWEFRVLNAPDSGFPTQQVTVGWTPSGGWVVEEGPTNTTLVGEWDGSTESGWNFNTNTPFQVYKNGELYFDSTNYTQIPQLTDEEKAQWNATIEEWRIANNIPDPNLSTDNASADIYAASEELNIGLSFQDGQWIVNNNP